MFGLPIKGLGAFFGGSINDTIKAAIKQNFTSFVGSIKNFAFEKYKNNLLEGEQIALTFIETDNQIIYLVGVLDGSLTITKILEKGNLYDLLMSLDYDQMLKEMKNAQNEVKNGNTK